MNIAIIPAYNPDSKLVELVYELIEKGNLQVVVVDDGSDERCQEVFDNICDVSILLRHQLNRGKGAAIKTALKYLYRKNLDIHGVVILDADGQHKVDDALNLLMELEAGDCSFALGVRTFSGEIPLRSRLGNNITKYIFYLFSGKWVSDTQTGLRAFKQRLIPQLLLIDGERYEYEMNVLLTLAKAKTPILEVPIETIYHDKQNSCSHFRTVRDSFLIYKNLILFSGSSFVSFLLDYIIFFPLVYLFTLGGFGNAMALVLGNISARLVSAAFNYHLNKTYVFKYCKDHDKSALQYALLAISILILNTIILSVLYDHLGLSKAIAKLITEMTLFIISFTVQKLVIFNQPDYPTKGFIECRKERKYLNLHM